MSTLLLVAIFLLLIFSILYLSIYSEFNEIEFNNRLIATIEYMKRTNAEFPLPDTLAYVSEIDDNFFILTRFDTKNLTVVDKTLHDDREEFFDFLQQKLVKVPFTLSLEPRVKAHSQDKSKYLIRGDDDWIIFQCPADEHFDETTLKCVPIPPCEGKSPGLYPLTERLIDTLVLNHRVAKTNENPSFAYAHHPTMYLRCVAGGSHVVEQCPDNHIFDGASSTCKIKNDCENKPDNYILNVFPQSLNINEYLVCENEQIVVKSCPNSKIFDRRLLRCVIGDPCAVNGAGFTFITDGLGPNQFIRCTSNRDHEIVTCIRRILVDGQYQCTGDVRCISIENGTGELYRTHEDDVVSFKTGVLVCDNYEVVEDLNCNVADLLNRKMYNNKFTVNVMLPSTVYNTTLKQCEVFDEKMLVDGRITVKNDVYSIENVDNDYNINFNTAFVGESDKLNRLLTADKLDGLVRYARDINAVGVNITSEPIDCFGDHLYDIFEGSKLNICDESTNILKEQINFKDTNDYFVSKLVKIARDDPDYKQFCSLQMDNTVNFVELDHFVARILTNITENDVCGDILTKIHIKYTTNRQKYTTIALQYTPIDENKPEYIEVYEKNIQNNDSTIVPAFNPFVPMEIIAPMFNPFDLYDPIYYNDQSFTIESDEEENENDNDNDNTIVSTPPPSPSPSPVPELILNEKNLNYSCFYSLPTFKLSGCNVDNDHIVNTLVNLRTNVHIHPECENAAGLVNVINSYAYIGGNVGCRCYYDDDRGIVINKVTNPTIFSNVDTQSNDNTKYNPWIHVRNNQFLACPPDLIQNDFTCNVESNVLYFLEHLQ
ncbi:vp91 [Malacosoma neustria nucleopolyhedrovirus]|uniref:vp91 n=1 Tax=Malacosoma neustria nuclear polyhedrosis virus TaxID=38012 RepID=UPI000E360CB0|nr:vp91 [Malacosoma neustria nucleopolyhedrovirus]AUF81593.1 vp91 [Malacosoma neustria nucleopolyhedrovirus]